MIKDRKKVLLGFIVGLVVLALGSVASACTVWVGQFTVTTAQNADADRDDPYERVRTYGLGTGMNHCWMAGAVKVHVGAPHSTSNIEIDYRALDLPTPAQIVADPANPANGATAACAVAAKRAPKDGWYTISYLNTGFGDFVGGNAGGGLISTWDEDSRAQRVYVRDCMAVGGAASRWNQQASSNNDFQVSGGVGNWSGQIRPKPSNINGGSEIRDLPGTESAICIQQAAGSYTGAPDGGQAPIIVI